MQFDDWTVRLRFDERERQRWRERKMSSVCVFSETSMTTPTVVIKRNKSSVKPVCQVMYFLLRRLEFIYFQKEIYAFNTIVP